ncbi:iron-containing redox enzyme family protein [Amycolatopsis sp. NPDC058340]|uniref:iron-containing redox enzyme family protein n=1 Tax=Amycolatopsis sp. NPDC058340 TaxID=3346453 RepID=UPI0036693C14
MSARVIEALTGSPGQAVLAEVRLSGRAGSVRDEDLQLALYLCYELHYRGFAGVDERWEWDPGLLSLRSVLERGFERDLLRRVGRPVAGNPRDLPATLTVLVESADGPPLARYLQRSATAQQFREFVQHRSVYHLKEADPHTWAVPRLAGPVKAALVDIQADEYGGGRADRMHSELFRSTMRAFGLTDTYGGYVDSVPAVTLATSNLISLFGLHRRWRGALIGHLAAFEMTSSLPNRRYGQGVRRLGGDDVAARFFDEHVTADAVHEQIATHDLCGGFARQHPELAGDVLFGAACCLELDAAFAGHLLDCWRRGVSSLRPENAARAS